MLCNGIDKAVLRLTNFVEEICASTILSKTFIFKRNPYCLNLRYVILLCGKLCYVWLPLGRGQTESVKQKQAEACWRVKKHLRLRWPHWKKNKADSSGDVCAGKTQFRPRPRARWTSLPLLNVYYYSRIAMLNLYFWMIILESIGYIL